MQQKRGRGRPKGSVNKPREESNLVVGGKPPVTYVSKTQRTHIYTTLSHTSLGNTELYNLYGIVIDASCPHPKKAFHRQLLKIIDPTMHYKPNLPLTSAEQQNGCVSVTFFAHNQDQLPQFKRVGDIIRIHRANIGIYKQYKTFSVNLAFGSSWCIFSGFDQKAATHETPQQDTVKGFFSANHHDHVETQQSEIRPYLSSSKEYTLSSVDQETVSRYRLWLQDYFANEFNYESTLYMSLNKVREFIMNEQSSLVQNNRNPSNQLNLPREYDLVVKVEKIQIVTDVMKVMTGGKQPEIRIKKVGNSEVKEIEEAYQVKVSDTSQMAFDLVIPQSLMPEGVTVGDVIRVKSVVASTHNNSKQVLVPTDHSNILIISKMFKLYQKFHTKIENLECSLNDAIQGVPQSSKIIQQPEPQKAESQPPYAFQDEVIEKPEICSTIGPQFKSYAVSSLLEAINNPEDRKLLRVQFQCVCVQPNNLLELCQLFCSTCKLVSSFRTLNQEGVDIENQGICSQCKITQLEPIFYLQMIVTDQSLGDQFARVLLYSNQALCNKFFNGISPTNLYRENTTRLMLERYIRQICRFNVIIDAVVEKFEVDVVKGRTVGGNADSQTVLRLVSSRLKPL